ncbi:MAG: preprotein translocase subunit SecE [Eubacteriaceae bacterium]|jgi:preprotein translocase subunit SecE|nr:preprotein translocase subunit SecE [Eubacteriaceae bacterium]MDK2937302.1 preprotein translocase subunit SecE [Eubacteriaceae bacterium]MDK2962428.1 preprotein translocase subunit SecE [Eubacteriaceae bacterium]
MATKKKKNNASKPKNEQNTPVQPTNDTDKGSNLVKEEKKPAVKSDKKSSKKSVDKNKKPNIFQRLTAFLKGVYSELRKVTWLNKQELAQKTGLVAGIVAIFTLLVWIVDTGLGALAALFLNV